MSPDARRIGELILVPAVITLAVTLLRLVGELQGWSPPLLHRWTLVMFNRGEEARSCGLLPWTGNGGLPGNVLLAFGWRTNNGLVSPGIPC